jgi:gluconate 2-dehydrogenase gamma chain
VPRMKDHKSKPNRRAFLGAGIATAGAAVSCTRSRSASGSAWLSFTAEQAKTVDAICAQFIPTDQDPGAKEAGVVYFIDLQLNRRYRKHRPVYQQGLQAVESASRSRFSRSFVELTPGQQVEILTAVEESSRAFFDLIVNHTRQGFYGDPRHGGNRNRVSWKMVGLAFPPVRGREHYQG